MLVELGASLEAVDKVHIHAHALANTCCVWDYEDDDDFLVPSLKSDHLIFCSKVFPNPILGSIKALY